MRNFVAVLIIMSVASLGHAGVIGDFEGTDFEGWSGNEGPDAVVSIVNDPNLATRGSQLLSLVHNGGYWRLGWDAPTIPTRLTTFKFDFIMLQADFPSTQWTKVADKISLVSDGVGGGWAEYTWQDAIFSWTDPTNTTDCPSDWGAWDPDAKKTYSMDVSDYDMTDATYFEIYIAVQGGQGPGGGIFYFDNFRLLDEAYDPIPDNGGVGVIGGNTTLECNNAVDNLDTAEVWFGEAPYEITDANLPGYDPDWEVTLNNYKTKLSLIDTIASPGVSTSTAMPALVDGDRYAWVVDGRMSGPVADPNFYQGPLWMFVASTNTPPTADAGPDQYKWLVDPAPSDPNIIITLDGTGTTDDALPSLTYLWTQTAGETVTIDTPNAATSTVTLPPDVASATEDGMSSSCMLMTGSLTIRIL